MSLLDFDNDDAGITVTTTTDAGFYGNTASIDDPFGFDVFGSNSTGSVKTKSGSADVAKTGNPFDDFDPFGGFGDGSSNVVTTTTSFSATSSSFSKPATDNQFAFDDDFSNNNPTGVVTETNTHLWGGGGDDDFHKGGSSLEEPNGGSDVIHGGNGVIHGGNDVTHDHHQPSSEEEITEVSGGVTEPSVFAGDAFWRVDCSSTEKHLSTSLHSDIATPYFDTTVPVDNSLGDSDCETAPDDAVEDSISTTKETENVALTGSRCDVGLVNGTDVPGLPETSFAFGVSENDEMSEESTYPAGLEANGQADISDSAVPTAASIHTVSLGGFTGSVESDRENTKGSNSGWFDHDASYEKDVEVRTSEKTEDKVDMGLDSRSKPDEEVPDFQKTTSQDFPLTNHRDAPTADHSHTMTSERETIGNESYSFNQDRGWKPDHTAMAEKDNTDDFEYQFKAQPDNRRHDVNSHRGQEDNSLADYFSSDNRGRISIDEIRQRSYEDMEPLRSASSHDRNQKEQKTTTDSKTPSVYVLGAASDSTCKVCSKRVYEMEKITADLQVYHKTCFRCTHCSRILSLGNFSTNEGRLYCKPHFMEIFKTKGNYKEGFAAAERNRQQGDRHDISDPEDQQGLNGRSRHSSEENGLSRMRHSSSGREEEYDEADDGAYLQEEIPVVQIKSVRSMFEKMSQDKASHAAGQPKKAARTSQVPQSTERGQGKQADQVRRDSLRSEGEREEHERRGSVGDREVVQSSTVCIVEEELPPPSFTKSMLAKFRMMEDVSGGGGAKPALPNYGKPASSKQPSSGSTGRHHQTLANRSSSGSNEDDVNETTPTSRQHSSAEEQADELPQAGHAKSLLAQWRNIEEQTKQRGRNRELKKTSTNARRSQSMSRVETVQRANVYRNIDLGSPRSKQAEDIGRSGSYSDQEASEDDAPVSMPTKRSLAKFKELEGGQSMHETDGSHKAKRKFKWEVKEAVPLNRGGIIVHGDVPKRPTTEAADVVRGSEGVADNVGDDYDGRLKRNDVDGRREFDVDSDDVVHQSVLTVFNEDELPAPATTRTLLQHFKSMEDVTKAPPLPRPAPSEAAREARSKTRPAAASGAFHSSDSDYDEAYRNQKRHSVHSDSEDIQNADAAKESDACDGEELPAQGTTRSLLAKFQSFQTKN